MEELYLLWLFLNRLLSTDERERCVELLKKITISREEANRHLKCKGKSTMFLQGEEQQYWSKWNSMSMVKRQKFHSRTSLVVKYRSLTMLTGPILTEIERKLDPSYSMPIRKTSRRFCMLRNRRRIFFFLVLTNINRHQSRLIRTASEREREEHPTHRSIEDNNGSKISISAVDDA